MAEQQPKVGDAGMIDGQELTVSAVEPNGKPIVRFSDDDALARAGLVSAVRKEHGPAIAANEKAIKAAMKEFPGPENRSKRKLAVLTLAVPGEALHKALTADLDEIPRGMTISANVRDVEYVAAGNCWTVRGRLLSFKDRQRAKGRVV